MGSQSIYGQIEPEYDEFGRPILIDTTALNEGDTIINKNGFFSIFKGKPGKAALLSLVIPSGGQVYNKRWWKVPLALGIDGTLTYVLINNRKQYQLAEDRYLRSLAEQDPASPRYREQRDYFRKYSEYAWVWLVGGHLVTVVDAYVDRHLMDFDISPDLSLIPLPGTTPSFVLGANIKINLNKKERVIVNPDFVIR